MYHSIGYPPKDAKNKGLWVNQERFKRQLSYLKEHNYKTITFEDLVKGWDENDLPDNPVIITFDDGYASNYTLAFPILKEVDFKATIFLNVGFIGRERYGHRFLSWEEIREMQDYGIEFGSHGMSHRNLVKIKEKEAKKEIEESKRILETFLGKSVVALAYPYGAGSDTSEVKNLVAKAGYIVACGTRKGKNSPGEGRFALKRLSMAHVNNLLDFHLLLTRGRVH